MGMKALFKKMSCLTLAVVLLLPAASAMAAERTIRVAVDGQYIGFPQAPVIQDGSTLVPFRAVFETFNCKIDWNENDRSVLATKGGTEIKLKIDDKMASVNGKQMELSVPPVIIGGSTMIPLRFVSEALGYGVHWDGLGYEVSIRTDGVVDNGRNYPQGLKGKKAYVYFNSKNNLYRVISDGSQKPQLLIDGYNSIKMEASPDYLFYYAYSSNENSDTHTLLRLPTDGTKKMGARFIDDEVADFKVYNGYVYYLNSKGFVYRIPENVTGSADAMAKRKEVASMVKTNKFYILDNLIYFNTLKDGRYPYVASKAIDGSGSNTWVAEGFYVNNYLIGKDHHNVYLAVNSNPQETEYSTDCVIIYTSPRSGGAGTPVNKDAPLDLNAAYSGGWAGRLFTYNHDVEYAENSYPNYEHATGGALDIYGYTYQMPNKGVREMVAFDKNRVLYTDGDANPYIANVSGGELSNIQKLDIGEIYYVRNLMNSGYIRATMLFGQGGTYVVKDDLSIQQLQGVEWDMCIYKEDVDGIFYVNAADNGYLYWISGDGSTTTKLADLNARDVSLIVPIEK